MGAGCRVDYIPVIRTLRTSRLIDVKEKRARQATLEWLNFEAKEEGPRRTAVFADAQMSGKCPLRFASNGAPARHTRRTEFPSNQKRSME